MLVAIAFIAVGCTEDPLEPDNSNQDGTEQTPGTGDNGDGSGDEPGGEDPGENPGGEDPGENPGGENPGENPEEPTLPGTEISLFDFAQLPNTDETLYRVSGVVWTVDVEDNGTMVILGTRLYDEDDFDPTKDAVAGIMNPTWLKDLNPALRPGHVLTVVGHKGAFGDDPDGDTMILNSQYVSHVDYSEPYLVFDMYVKPYLYSESGAYTFNVYSNTDWTVTAPEGTGVSPASGNGCAELTFKYPANASFQDVFYPLVFSYSGKTAELKFQQEALRYSLEISQQNVEVAADATTASVDVVSNGSWTVTTPEGVTATPASGNGNATVTFTFPANTTQEPVQYVAQIAGNGNSEERFVYEFIIDQAAAEKEVVLEDGKYWIVANGKVAMPLSGNYGYINVEDAWVSASSYSSVEGNAFTFKAVEGGYTIQDESGKYYYQTGTYNSFNVNASTQADGSHIWTIEKVENTYKITNNVMSKYIQFSNSYGNFGSYNTATGDLPTLVKVENAVPAINLEESLTFEHEGGSQNIKLPEEVTVTATSDNPAFTVSAQAGLVTVTADATTDAQSGNLTLVLTCNGFSVTKKISLSQKAAPAAGSVVLLEEDFSSLTSWSTSAVTTLKVNNLTYSTAGGSMYAQKGCIKFGKSTAAANTGIKLPQLTSLTEATDVTLSFKAVSSDAAYTMVVSATNGATVGTLSPKTITKNGSAINSGADTATALAAAFAQSTAEFSVTISGVTSATVISIVASGSAKRWYLDDLKIEKK